MKTGDKVQVSPDLTGLDDWLMYAIAFQSL
ncbi:hypothetical protein GGQ57_002467 [Parabacteroides faecis]|uniref:Uncharacterized protein n=1 Tax=Parabacteroides faecis TaxID=1217282 RepID=A0ABR6KM22_9BACT|nr:hypothetical protein [Parabacteroides faecis]